ncbi:DNA-formamidopyrimidine glycosylase family protein [Mucilaginibacter pedocola]|uniref:Endonuclease n=1 Tax=Mucilaginibacter pedocola TaxID=1792845 RepID=A0A1S9PEI6_9SPHI|nr:DNA-formamidopyrimidine glycosylase family protein [Mucilaginibacter pedocola]OOQ59363.1 endonuclease [Mucilaginibacter pedocola]
MPEGPIIVILKEEALQFKGQKVIKASCNNRAIDAKLLVNQTVTDLKSWGKHFLICFPHFTIRVHMMMFGSYRINSHTTKPARLHLGFEGGGELNFYASQLKLIEEPLNSMYDWKADVMSDKWDTKAVIKKMKELPELLACDALMDQHLFSGVGNIIKNEVLFRIRVHPESLVSALPPKKVKEMISEAINYSFEFLGQKKTGKLKKNWHAYDKKICPRDEVPFIKRDTGRSHRTSYYCEICMKKYV